MLFSLLDNFGFSGGRNGFIFIQGVGKQDIAVGILFFFISSSIFVFIKKKEVSDEDLLILGIIVLFLIQLKMSSIIILYLYFLFISFILIYKLMNISHVLTTQIPLLLLGVAWLIKNYLTTGCLIFPLEITCINNFEWYVNGSTNDYQGIVRLASSSYNLGEPFNAWLIEMNSYEYRKSVFLNFLVSFVLIFIVKFSFFSKRKLELLEKSIAYSYILLGILYFIFFGPIPRYAFGICLTTIFIIAIHTEKISLKLPRLGYYFVILVSVVLLIRPSSYMSLINNSELIIFDPRANSEINYEIGFIDFNENWVYPNNGEDQCWTNIKCTMARSEIIINEGKHFNTAFKY